MAQAGVYLGYFHADQIENHGSTFDDSNDSSQTV